MNSVNQFSGKWAVILGGSSGFGRATMEKLAAHGMNIAVLYRETAAVERQLKQDIFSTEKATGVKILPLNINALTEQGRQQFLQSFLEAGATKNSVRILLHSIARGNLKDLTSEKADQQLSTEDLQLTTYAMSNSLLDWTRLLADAGLFADTASVIGLTSEGAHKYWDSYAAVSVAKSSLESLATYMAVEFAKYGLRTNIIQAGVTNTPSFNQITRSDELIKFTTNRNPLGRMTKPSDVANVIYLLCLPEAGWINGALIHVDGGEHCR